jgi:hypothetical protein
MIIIYINKKKYISEKKNKKIKKGANRLEFQTVWAKPSRIPDGLGQTVWKFISRHLILDGFKPSIINRLELFPDGFFQFLDGLKPSRICVFFVVSHVQRLRKWGWMRGIWV